MILRMNIHPIIVHFPIALLCVYAILECVRIKKLLRLSEWFYVKTSFLIFGVMGALLAAATGDFGKPLYPGERGIIEVHERFADITIVIFCAIALLYLVMLADRLFQDSLRRSRYTSSWGLVMRIENKLFIAPVLVPLAILGFLALFITGTLGGSIVYGVTGDPFTQFINRIFVLQ